MPSTRTPATVAPAAHRESFAARLARKATDWSGSTPAFLVAVLLIVVWAGAAAGLVLNLAWVDAPKWLTALVFVALGWVGVVAVPEMLDLGVAPAVLVFAGGGLYTLGAITYALRRPNPVPHVFGYHEIFHVLVIAAAAAHFVAIAGFVLPQA